MSPSSPRGVVGRRWKEAVLLFPNKYSPLNGGKQHHWVGQQYIPIFHSTPAVSFPNDIKISVLKFYLGQMQIRQLSVQFSHSVMSDSLRPHELQHARASLSITNSRSLLKLMSMESVMPSSHLILCRPLLLLPSIFPSIRVFSNESTLHIRWPKYQSFSFNIRPSSEHPGLISSRMDQLNLFAVQGTLKSLLQHHSSKSINFLALSFLHSPTLTSIHDHWKNHSLDQTDLCWQSSVSAFQYAIQVGHNFPSKA